MTAGTAGGALICGGIRGAGISDAGGAAVRPVSRRVVACGAPRDRATGGGA